MPAQSAAFAAGVPPDICAFHRYTRNSTLPYWTLVTTVSGGVSRLSLEVSHPTYRTTYELFTPNKSGQRLPPTCYRGCWHVVGWGFFCGYRLGSSPLKAVYNPRAFIPHAALLRQAFAHCARFPLLPPVGVWAVSQSSVADRPLRPATRRRLGGPLPHQQADRPRGSPGAESISSPGHATRWRYPVLALLSEGYPGLRGKFLTCYSPVRH